MDQAAKNQDSLLKTANKILLTSQIFAFIFSIFSGILGSIAVYLYVSYDDGSIATCAESSMEIKCSNVECYQGSTQFGDCEDGDLIPSAILLIVISLSELIHFFWACRCFRDYKCYDAWDTPLLKRKYQILSILVMRVIAVVVESFWVVIFANYKVVEPDCQCESTLFYDTYGTALTYKNRVSNIVMFNQYYLVFVVVVFIFCIIEAVWYIWQVWKKEKTIDEQIRGSIEKEKDKDKEQEKLKKKAREKQEKEKEKRNKLEINGVNDSDSNS